MRSVLALPALALLAACATPRERCIADATRDLTVVTHLIAQLETDIARGYGTQDVQVTTPTWRPCYRRGGYYRGHDGKLHPRDPVPDMCWVDEVQTVQRPVAIDLADTRRKLDELRKKQVQLSRAAGPAVQQCQALYPE